MGPIENEFQLRQTFVSVFNKTVRGVSSEQFVSAFVDAYNTFFGENVRVADDGPKQDIYAVGLTPEDAIQSLCGAGGWGAAGNFQPLDNGDSGNYDWARKFVADGTSFKAAGTNVPGGVAITWWK